MKTLILSDLHLGTGASRAADLLATLAQVARHFDRVILNGDTLDRYDQPAVQSVADHWLRQVREALCGRNGPPEFLSGNHDPAVSEQTWTYLPAAQTLVFHGDCVADGTHPSKPEDQALAARLRERWRELGGRPATFLALTDEYRRVQHEHVRTHPRHEARGLVEYVARALYPPRKPFDILRYWYLSPRRVAALSATFDRPVRRAVFGHTHRPGRWRLNGIEVFNTGSFMPVSTPYAVVADGESLEWLPVRTLVRRYAGATEPERAWAPAPKVQ